MHKCVRCGSLFEDGNKDVLRGCTECGGIFFMYLKDESDINQFDTIKKELEEKDISFEEEVRKKIDKIKERKVEEDREEKWKSVDHVSEIKGIGDKTSKKLEKAGVETIDDLIGMETRRLAEKLGASVKTAEKFQKRARRIKGKTVVKVGKKEGVRKEVVIIGGRKYAIEVPFGVETVRIPKRGVYEINIDGLMKENPVIVLENRRVYFLHLPLLFEELDKSKRK